MNRNVRSKADHRARGTRFFSLSTNLKHKISTTPSPQLKTDIHFSDFYSSL